MDFDAPHYRGNELGPLRALADVLGTAQACPLKPCRRHRRCCWRKADLARTPMPPEVRAEIVSRGLPFCLAAVWDELREPLYLALKVDLGR